LSLYRVDRFSPDTHQIAENWRRAARSSQSKAVGLPGKYPAHGNSSKKRIAQSFTRAE